MRLHLAFFSLAHPQALPHEETEQEKNQNGWKRKTKVKHLTHVSVLITVLTETQGDLFGLRKLMYP